MLSPFITTKDLKVIYAISILAAHPFCAILDSYKKKMHRNTNEICRCFLPDINVGHNIALVSGQRQFLPLSLAYNECDMFGFFYTHQILFIKSKRKPRFV